MDTPPPSSTPAPAAAATASSTVATTPAPAATSAPTVASVVTKTTGTESNNASNGIVASTLKSDQPSTSSATTAPNTTTTSTSDNGTKPSTNTTAISNTNNTSESSNNTENATAKPAASSAPGQGANPGGSPTTSARGTPGPGSPRKGRNPNPRNNSTSSVSSRSGVTLASSDATGPGSTTTTAATPSSDWDDKASTGTTRNSKTGSSSTARKNTTSTATASQGDSESQVSATATLAASPTTTPATTSTETTTAPASATLVGQDTVVKKQRKAVRKTLPRKGTEEGNEGSTVVPFQETGNVAASTTSVVGTSSPTSTSAVTPLTQSQASSQVVPASASSASVTAISGQQSVVPGGDKNSNLENGASNNRYSGDVRDNGRDGSKPWASKTRGGSERGTRGGVSGRSNNGRHNNDTAMSPEAAAASTLRWNAAAAVGLKTPEQQEQVPKRGATNVSGASSQGGRGGSRTGGYESTRSRADVGGVRPGQTAAGTTLNATTETPATTAATADGWGAPAAPEVLWGKEGAAWGEAAESHGAKAKQAATTSSASTAAEGSEATRSTSAAGAFQSSNTAASTNGNKPWERSSTHHPHADRPLYTRGSASRGGMGRGSGRGGYLGSHTHRGGDEGGPTVSQDARQGSFANARDARSSLDARKARQTAGQTTAVGGGEGGQSTVAIPAGTPTGAPESGTLPGKDANNKESFADSTTIKPSLNSDRPSWTADRETNAAASGTQSADVRNDTRYNSSRTDGPGGPGARSYPARGTESRESRGPPGGSGPLAGRSRRDNLSTKEPRERYPSSPRAQNSDYKKPPPRKVLLSTLLHTQLEWDDIKLRPQVVASINRIGLAHPSNIQKLALTQFINGVDIIGQAQSQEDRTNTIAIGLLQRLVPDDKSCQAVVILSDRVQPQQVHKELCNWFDGSGLNCLMLMDKTDEEIKDDQSPKQVVVATLGRLMEVLTSGVLELSSVRNVSISMGQDELVKFESFKQFWVLLPRMAQVVMLTGVITPMIQAVKDQYFRADTVVVRADELTMKWSEHYFIAPSATASASGTTSTAATTNVVEEAKQNLVLKVFEQNPAISHTVIVTPSQSVTEALSEKLKLKGLPVMSVWSMADKTKVTKQFNEPAKCILVIELGLLSELDLDHFSLIINYEVSRRVPFYLSNFGPFGRAGLRSMMINLIGAPPTSTGVEGSTEGGMSPGPGSAPATPTTPAATTGGYQSKYKQRQQQQQQQQLQGAPPSDVLYSERQILHDIENAFDIKIAEMQE